MTKYIIHGGFTRYENELNNLFYKEFVKDIPDSGTILVIFFASGNEDRKEAFEDQKRKFTEASNGKSFNCVYATEEHFIEQLAQADALFINGGDTTVLLRTLRQFENIQSYFTQPTIAGSSAGAYALAKWGTAHTEEHIREGLGLLPLRVICHHESEELPPSNNSLKEIKEIAEDLELVKLKDCEWKVFEKDGELMVLKSLIFPYNSKGQLFIQDRRGNKAPDWGFFGGSVEEDESPLTAVIRETKEELSIDITKGDLVFLGTSDTEWEGFKRRFLYMYKTDQKEFDVLEGNGGEWLDLNEARKRLDINDRFDQIVDLIQKAK